MRRYILACLLVAVLVMAPAIAYADATVTSSASAKTASIANGISQVVGIAAVSDGRVLEIDNEGSASVKEYPKTIANTLSGSMSDGVLLVTGACRVSNIIVSGSETTAEDYVLIYDALTATGTPKFDISVGTAGETVPIMIPGGATFATGVFAVGGDAVSKAAITTTILYDN